MNAALTDPMVTTTVPRRLDEGNARFSLASQDDTKIAFRDGLPILSNRCVHRGQNTR